MTTEKGLIISIFGIDGCGKGTQIQALMNWMRENNLTPFYSKAYGEAEKEQFAGFLRIWSATSRMFAFQAFHSYQYEQAMKAIKRREIVCADRWDESYYVFHGKSNESPLKTESNKHLFEHLNQLAFNGCVPDVSILIDIDIETARKRTTTRGQDFFDAKSDEYHSLMREGYLEVVEKRNGNIIDGTGDWGIQHKKIIEIVKGFL